MPANKKKRANKAAWAGRVFDQDEHVDCRADILLALEQLWDRYPYYRLGQLIVNVADAPGNDPFFIEDDEMLRKFKAYP